MKEGRVLVTGAAGYIGSHTVVELVNAGYEVVGVDNFSNSSPDMLKGIERITGKRIPFMELDCSDRTQFAKVFEQYPDITASIHFAACKAVGESVRQPLKYFENNLSSLLHLIELSVEDSRRRGIVFSSSCTVYGEPDPENLPVREDAPVKPATSPYGRTKQMNEEILRDCVNAYPSLNVIALRYFNPIGAHPSALIGEMPLGVPQNLVPYITQTAAGIRKELKIFGNDYPTPDGTCIRDYIYVCDLAKAHVAAVAKVLEDGNNDRFDIFNLGTGTGLSVLELVNHFIKATGVNLPYSFGPRREGDIVKVWADPAKANKELGWKADTPVDDVLRSAWAWEKKVRGIE
ncbi:MAG TPA: UDP-glucose 4-epimerase GalE [Candidatus Coprenecus stercoravium]|uniref:UDP-glucose 4-epimerase n=1 Tax=Candidatus Coprenecus stercoravium TaxID=2840735 RepID=A0A9D2K9N2_9BACT|nr:UDP-glucose 4-epimerase GalE [Candidatus Coprenecus stercoravium]